MTTTDRHAGPASLGARALWAAQTFVMLGLIWLALNGLDGWWVGWLAASAGAAVGAALATGRPYPWKPRRLVMFAGFFLLESFKGGLDVAWRALAPGARIAPGFFLYPLDLPAGQPRTLMVSVHSLLPGTLSAELSEDGRTLRVHALGPGARAATARLDAQVRRLFLLPEAGHG